MRRQRRAARLTTAVWLTSLACALTSVASLGRPRQAEAAALRPTTAVAVPGHPSSTLAVGSGPRPGARATARATVPGAGWTLRTCLTVTTATAHRRACASDRSSSRHRALVAAVRLQAVRHAGRAVATRTAHLERAGRTVAAFPAPAPASATATHPGTTTGSPASPAAPPASPAVSQPIAAPTSTAPTQTGPDATTPVAPPARCVGDAPQPYPADPALRPRPYADEPAYAELGVPSGPPAGAVLLLHGGGFTNTGPRAAASERPQAFRWLQRGWIVLNASYRPCGQAVGDAEWSYDRLARDHPGIPLCVSGSSVGGSLAIHLATTRPTSCAISRSGILEPEQLAGEPIDHPHDGAATTGTPLFDGLQAALGADGLAGLIDQRTFARAAARVLIVREANDWVVPGVQQDDALALRQAGGSGYRTRELTLTGAEDDPYFVHGQVSPAESSRYAQAEGELAAGLAGPPPPVG